MSKIGHYDMEAGNASKHDTTQVFKITAPRVSESKYKNPASDHDENQDEPVTSGNAATADGHQVRTFIEHVLVFRCKLMIVFSRASHFKSFHFASEQNSSNHKKSLNLHV